jgi:ribosome-associated toxin RatA of RatAB toxin-antitoxin module
VSKAYDPNLELDCLTVTHNTQAELESETASAITNPAILPDLEVKTELIEGRKCRVCAKIQVPHSLEQVWQVLTDYENYPEFIPHLTQNRRLDSPTSSIRLEEVSIKSFMGMKFVYRAIFDVEQKFPQEIHYQLIAGEFKALYGYYRLDPWLLADNSAGTLLCHNFIIWPKRFPPVGIVERVLRRDTPVILLAIRQRVEALSVML